MRITFVVPSIRCGGAERILTAMANYWAEKGKEVTILSFDKTEARVFYTLSSNIKLVSLDMLGNSKTHVGRLNDNIRRFVTLRKAIQSTRPDIIISFLIRTNVRVLFASLGLQLPIIISERSDPFLAQPGRLWQMLAKIIYPRAAGITVFTAHAANYFSPSLRKKLRVIPNPVAPANYKAVPQDGLHRLVAVGRLEYVKGFDLLLKAFALVRQQLPSARLTIWGEGSKRLELESLCEALGLVGYVQFPGITKDIAKVLAEADLFVQSSRWEGFGNALCEAMAVGLPVISTNCSGPKEIIRNGIDGQLVPVENIDALANAILALLHDFSRRQTLAKNALEITKRFALPDIMKQWELLLEKATV